MSSNGSDSRMGVDETPRPAWIDAGRVPTLDGFRGIAIGLVLLSHAGDSAGWGIAQAAQPLSFGGLIGVDLFFLISGFLITTLLLREAQRNGRIDLSAFYLRRCLRILPASVSYLTFVAVLTSLGICRVSEADWCATLSYLVNFVPQPAKAVGHFWSLSVEEQFYLLWPPLFAALILQRRTKHLAVVAALALGLAPASRLTILAIWPDFYGVSRWWTPNRIDGIAAGCLMASIARASAGVARLDRFSQRWPLFGVGCLALQLGGRRLSGYLAAFVPTLEVAALAGIIWTTARSAPRRFDRGPLAWLGVLSYSIYLWQQPFLIPDRPRWWSTWPQNLPLALLCAFASHWIIEQPFLKFKDRFNARSSGRSLGQVESPVSLIDVA